ncbi:MAG: aminotransferase class V-fold PLP-dependent enzyme, partial [Gammaproteobacteria bacterium]
WPVDAMTGSLRLEDLETLLNERTRIVAFTHCSNVVGQINPVAKITARIRAAGAMSMVDGVSYAAHGFPDVTELGADVYLFSLYKTFGPHQGLMVVRRAVAERFANQSHYFNDDQPRKRLIPAGPDHAQVAAAQGIADYFESMVEHHFETPPDNPRAALASLFAAAEHAHLTPILEALNAHPRVRIVGPKTAEQRAPTVSFVVDNKNAHELNVELAENGVMCGSGHFYAARLLDAMGIGAENGVVRWSFLHYTSEAEVQRALDALQRLI